MDKPRLDNLVCLVALWAAASSGAVRAADGDLERAKATLEAHGLRQSGDWWLLPDEFDLRAELARLDVLEREYHVARQRVEELVAANEEAARKLAEARAKVDKIKAALKDATLTGSERKRAEDQLREDRKRAAEASVAFKDDNALGATDAARAAVEKLISLRNRLDLTALSLRQRLAPGALKAAYDKTAKAPEVATALDQVGPRQKLGPARDYQGEIRRVEAIERLTRSAETPVYRVDNHFRIGGIVNDRAAAEFSLRHSTGPTVIPDSLARAADIRIDSHARRIEYVVDPQRKLIAREIMIDKLRIGGVELTQIRALVLPPEGEDLAAKLGQDALFAIRVDIRGRQLKASFTRAN